MRKLALSAGLAVGLIGGNVFADHGQITGAALEDLFAGATAHGKTSKGVNYTTKFNPDGSVKLDAISGFKDSGKWRLNGNAYCATWKKVRKGKDACWEVFHKAGDDYHLKTTDGLADSIDVKMLK